MTTIRGGFHHKIVFRYNKKDNIITISSRGHNIAEIFLESENTDHNEDSFYFYFHLCKNKIIKRTSCFNRGIVNFKDANDEF